LPRIEVTLHGSLRRYAPGGSALTEVRVDEGMTLGGILELLGVPRHSVSFGAVNGRKAAFDRVPCDGDKVAFFSPFSGG
jgi:molybdopterin converting factor small subunit